MSLLHGVDVSAFQAADVLRSLTGLGFALVKVSEGKDWTSPVFRAQWADAKTHAQRRGGYHFARPEESSAHDQCSRFLDLLQPVPGEIVMLDLEASQLSQTATNAWARAFGDELADQAPGVADWLYMGSGYATNNTGKGLSAHFKRWMYPQYPSAYQLTSIPGDMRTELEEEHRTLNRSSLIADRTPIAAMTTSWPPAVTPWLPSGLTCGWSRPDIWQFTDNWRGLDASVTALTLDQLANGGQTPQEDDMISGSIPAGKGPFAPILISGFKHVYFGFDNTYENADVGVTRQVPAVFRVAMHVPGRSGKTVQNVTVGAAPTDTKGWADNVGIGLPSGCDRIDIVRLDDGNRPVGFWVG